MNQKKIYFILKEIIVYFGVQKSINKYTSMNWKDIKIHIKLLIASGITLILSVIIGGIGITNLNRINNNTKDISLNYLPVVNNGYGLI